MLHRPAAAGELIADARCGHPVTLTMWEANFHDALNAAIKSNEGCDAAETVERSKKLKREADDLIETSRDLVDDSKRRIAKYKKR